MRTSPARSKAVTPHHVGDGTDAAVGRQVESVSVGEVVVAAVGGAATQPMTSPWKRIDADAETRERR
ncbi:hypothetical protein [Streptomyces sp. NPDC055013]